MEEVTEDDILRGRILRQRWRNGGGYRGSILRKRWRKSRRRGRIERRKLRRQKRRRRTWRKGGGDRREHMVED
jgi:hypothetical protein